MRPDGGGASGGSLRSSRQAAACHPFTRSWATMPPEPPPPSGLHRVWIVACLCFNGKRLRSYVLTAGRGHASFLGALIFNEL